MHSKIFLNDKSPVLKRNKKYYLLTGLVWYSDHHLKTWHLNNGQIKVCYSDVGYSDVCYSDSHCKSLKQICALHMVNRMKNEVYFVYPVKWRSEIRTSPDFELSNRGWFANGPGFEGDVNSRSPTIWNPDKW